MSSTASWSLASNSQGERVAFSPEQGTSCTHVLRLRPGDRVRVFDGVEPVDRVVELTERGGGPRRGRCGRRRPSRARA